MLKYKYSSKKEFHTIFLPRFWYLFLEILLVEIVAWLWNSFSKKRFKKIQFFYKIKIFVSIHATFTMKSKTIE